MVVVYDIETCASAFTYSAINTKTDEIYQYVIHEGRDDRVALFEHLQQCKGQIGFNNINFDYVVLHYFMTNYQKWSDFSFSNDNYWANSEEIALNLYHKAQEIIESQDKDTFYKTIAIPTKQWKIHQLDLFKLWHYNNKARRRIAA